MKEQQVQSKKIKELEAQGYYVIKLTMTNKNGIPDLLAIPRNSDVIFIEVKATNGKLSKLQEYRLKELQNHGVKVEVFKGEEIKSNDKEKEKWYKGKGAMQLFKNENLIREYRYTDTYDRKRMYKIWMSEIKLNGIDCYELIIKPNIDVDID